MTMRSFHHTVFFVIAAATLGGCSTAANPGGDSWPEGWNRTGYFVKCTLAYEPIPTTGDPNDPNEGVVCVHEQSLAETNAQCGGAGETVQPLPSDVYLLAICAKTFGGVPSDYVRPNVDPFDWRQMVDNYPEWGDESTNRCDVNIDVWFSNEDPVATNIEPLIATNPPDPPYVPYNSCSLDSYCQMLEDVMAEFPGEGDLSDPFRCNLGPNGDVNEPRPWRCVGSSSTNSMTGACGVLWGNHPVCPKVWHDDPLVSTDGQDLCVLADSEADASSACEDLCGAYHDLYLTFYEAWEYPPSDYIDCSVFGPNTMTWVADPAAECDNRAQIDPLSVSMISYSGGLAIDGGTNAVSNSNGAVGLLDYRFENCAGSTCDVVIENIALSALTHTGNYFDVNGLPFPYSIHGIKVEMLEPLRGVRTINPASGASTLSFSSGFDAWVIAGDVEVNSISLGPVDPFVASVSNVSGTYTGGVLTLEVVYETVDSTIELTLTSL